MTTGLAIFDLDGTLADTIADIALTMNDVLVARGYPEHSLDDYRRFVGNGVVALSRRVIPEADHAIADDLVQDFRELYPSRMFDNTLPFPGIPETLDALLSAGVGLAVLSNKPHAMTQEMCARLFAAWPFEPVWGQMPEWKVKPDPASTLEVARRRGVDPANCVFIGDSGVDMATGKAAGMKSDCGLLGFLGLD
ncbi:HAD family hydrolase [bacterium]|nr:HAD family hydrolase [bacterium]